MFLEICIRLCLNQCNSYIYSIYSIFFNLNNFYGIDNKLINALEFCLNVKGLLCAGSFSKIYFCTSGSLMILLDLWWSSPDLICELDQCKNWLITSNLTKIKTKCSNNYPLFLLNSKHWEKSAHFGPNVLFRIWSSIVAWN